MANKNKKMTLKQKRKQGMKLTKNSNSNYARKREYLDKNGGYGFEYSAPKPWK